jgi:hypothetical protein
VALAALAWWRRSEPAAWGAVAVGTLGMVLYGFTWSGVGVLGGLLLSARLQADRQQHRRPSASTDRPHASDGRFAKPSSQGTSSAASASQLASIISSTASSARSLRPYARDFSRRADHQGQHRGQEQPDRKVAMASRKDEAETDVRRAQQGKASQQPGAQRRVEPALPGTPLAQRRDDAAGHLSARRLLEARTRRKPDLPHDADPERPAGAATASVATQSTALVLPQCR